MTYDTGPNGLTRFLYTPAEAAGLLGLSRSRLYRLLASGELEHVRVGGVRRVPADALASFVDAWTGSAHRPSERGMTAEIGATWAAHLASSERLCSLATKLHLPERRLCMDDVLPLLCHQPAHPVVAELAEGWGLDGLAERLLVYCRSVPAVRRGELRAARLARRLDGAVRELTRDRHLVLGTPVIERAVDRGPGTVGSAVVEQFVRARLATLERVVGRALPEADRTVVEDLLNSTVDLAVAVAGRLGPGENALDVFARASTSTPVSRRLLPHLRRYWPEVPVPTLASVHRLVRYRVLDPRVSAEHAGPTVARSWRSCYPGLHRHVAEQMARHLSERDDEATRRLRARAVRGDWGAIEVGLAEPPAMPGMAA